MFPENLIRRRRTRQPWDEVLPTGETVAEAVQRLNGVGVDEAVQDAGLMPQRPVALNDPPVIPTASRVMTPPWNPNATPIDEPLTRRRIVGPSVSTTLTPEMADQSVIVRRPNVAPTGNVIEPELDTTLERPRRTQPRDMVADLSSYRRDVEQNPPKLSRGRAILAGLLQGLAMGGQSGLGGMLGGAATGAAIGAASPNTISRMRTQQQLGEIDRDITREAVIEDNRLDRDYKIARNEAIRQKPAVQQSTALNRQQAILLRQLSLEGKYKRGANPAFDAQLDAAQLEVSDFDKARQQRPRVRTKNGVDYKENPDGSWTPIADLPVDTSQVPDAQGYRPRDRAMMERQDVALGNQGVRQQNDIQGDVATADEWDSQAAEREAEAKRIEDKLEAEKQQLRAARNAPLGGTIIGTQNELDLQAAQKADRERAEALRKEAKAKREQARTVRAKARSQRPITTTVPQAKPKNDPLGIR